MINNGIVRSTIEKFKLEDDTVYPNWYKVRANLKESGIDADLYIKEIQRELLRRKYNLSDKLLQ